MNQLSMILILIIFFSVCSWIMLRCIQTEYYGNDYYDLHQIREQYHNQIIEMQNMQLNLEDTSYKTDRRLIKSLQEKYKIKINYNEYYEIEKFESKDNEKFNCIICLENYKYNDLIALMKCNHRYHYKCIKKWLNYNPNCPICRKDIIEERPEEVIININ